MYYKGDLTEEKFRLQLDLIKQNIIFDKKKNQDVLKKEIQSEIQGYKVKKQKDSEKDSMAKDSR